MRIGIKHLAKVVFLSAIILLPRASEVFAAPSIQETILELNVKGAGLKVSDAIEYADKYLKLVDDKTLNAADRAYALQGCMTYLTIVWNNGHKEAVVTKADEVFSHYSGAIVGSSPGAELYIVSSYMTFLGQLLAGGKISLAESLAIIDKYEDVLNLDTQNPRADLRRGAFCKTANDREQAVKFMERYISTASDPDGYAYSVLSWASEGLNRPDLTLTTVMTDMKRWGSYPGTANRNAQVLISLLNSGNLDESKMWEYLPVFAHEGRAMTTILGAIADQRLRSGDMDSVLACMKLCYAVTPIEDVVATSQRVGKSIATVKMDPVKATQFLGYQTYGTAGLDGQTGTDDDCVNLLADVGQPFSADVVKALEARLSQLTPREDCSYVPLGGATPRADALYALLRDRGCIYLSLGRPKEALRAFCCAWDAATVQWIEEANGLVPRALKALDGNMVRANAYMAYQEFGIPGPDGQMGTEDDLVNPLMEENLPPLPKEVYDALIKITENPSRSAGGFQLRGFAYLALGEYKKAFDQLRSAYVMVDPGPDQATIIENIAAVIKAFDGNVLRANQYLLFQKHGAAGPDGQIGTEDDVENLLPAILRDINKT